jgi:hypothetical protein
MKLILDFYIMAQLVSIRSIDVYLIDGDTWGEFSRCHSREDN